MHPYPRLTTSARRRTRRHEPARPSPPAPPRPRRLLGVWAHPDDETYLSGGLMARVVEHGGEVRVVTATRGEQGSSDPAQAGSTAFAAHRERELRACLAELGVTDLRILGCADGGCAAVPDDGPVEAIAQEVTAFQPDVIVTFGPDGITAHPDHVAVSRWATRAWCRSGTDAELLYATMSHERVRSFREVHERLHLFDDFGSGEAFSVPEAALALACALSPRELHRKRRALGQQRSQTTGVAELLGETDYRRWLRDELFRRPGRGERQALERPPTAAFGHAR